ncbi:MAG: ATP-binding protein [Chloroflexota bacterium]
MIISVASGKGGTGKTLVATSLALSLKGEEKVQLLDCDVEEPNAHIFLKPVITRSEPVFVPVPVIDEKKCTYCGDCAMVCAYHAIAIFPGHAMTFAQLCHGCGACTYFCPQKAVHEEGREAGVVERGYCDGVDFVHGRLKVGEAMAPPVIRRVKEFVDRRMVAIIDVSPGTSCPVITAVRDSDFCLLVTEPTPFGLNDLELAVQMVLELAIPHGVVINRAGVGNDAVEAYCRERGIPVLLTIPMARKIAGLNSRGVALVDGMPEWIPEFRGLYYRIREMAGEGSRCVKR